VTSNTTCYVLLIVKAVIEILYQLHNVVLHEELVPNRDAQKVYAAVFTF
jgi:hypothetical protein